MKTAKLELLLKKFQLDPESKVEPREIKELTVKLTSVWWSLLKLTFTQLEVHSHFDNGENDEYWVPSRVFMSAAKRMAEAVGSNDDPDFNAMSREDEKAKEHQWYDEEWFQAGMATPGKCYISYGRTVKLIHEVPSILKPTHRLPIGGAEIQPAPSTELQSDPVQPAITEAAPSSVMSGESKVTGPSAVDQTVETNVTERTAISLLQTAGSSTAGPLQSTGLTTAVPSQNTGSSVTGPSGGNERAKDAAVAPSRVSKRGKTDRVKSAQYVESDDDADAPPVSTRKGKRKAEERPEEDASKPVTRNKKPRSSIGQPQPVASEQDGCVRCQKARETCVKTPTGESCVRCKRLKARCTLVTLYKPRAKPGEGKKRNQKRAVKEESPILVEPNSPPAVIAATVQSRSGPSRVIEPPVENQPIKEEPASSEMGSVQVKKKTRKPKSLAALVPEAVPVPTPIPLIPAPPNPDLAALHQTIVRVDVIEAQYFELHHANRRLTEENSNLRGMVETLRRHVLEVSSTVDHLQGLVTRRATRDGSPDSIVDVAQQQVTNAAVQTDPPIRGPEAMEVDLTGPTHEDGSPQAGMGNEREGTGKEGDPSTHGPVGSETAAPVDAEQPLGRAINAVDQGVLGPQTGQTEATEVQPTLEQAVSAPASPTAPLQDGPQAAIELPSQEFRTSTPVVGTTSNPRTPLDPGNATQYIIASHETPSEAGNTSWDEHLHLDADLDPHRHPSGMNRPMRIDAISQWEFDGTFAATAPNPHPIDLFSPQSIQVGQTEPRFETICPQVLQPTNPFDSLVDTAAVENSGIDLQPSMIPDIAHLPPSDTYSSPSATNSPFF